MARSMSNAKESQAPNRNNRKKSSDDALKVEYLKTHSVSKTSSVIGCSVASAYARLKRLGVVMQPIGRPVGRATKLAAPSITAVQSRATALQRAQKLFGKNADRPHREWMIDTGPPAELPAARRDPEAYQRETACREAWWMPAVDVLGVDLMDGTPLQHKYRITLCTNQHLTKGDVEMIFVMGIPAVHRARGERPPRECLYAQGRDDLDEPLDLSYRDDLDEPLDLS